MATAKDNETVTDTPSIITGDTYTLYLDTSVLQLGQTYVTGHQQKINQQKSGGKKGYALVCCVFCVFPLRCSRPEK